MAGMKISLDSAMRARDVSQPRTADEAAAERTEASIAPGKPEPGTRPATNSHAPASTADPERTPPDRQQADGPQRQAATGRGRGHRHRPAPRTR
ncbi:MAG TPA: hypothetical protein VGH53_09050 [Streptosporangiaceae bacterium]|jgi:hypothetical protein